MKITALILAKSDSKRLPFKNTLEVKGEQMFLMNVRKCLKLFDEVYVSSDSIDILEQAMKVGARPIKRPKNLCGDTPNIPVYQHAMKYMEADAFIAVQANSPTVDPFIIEEAKKTIEDGSAEVITITEKGKIYGSVWGMTKFRLNNYVDFYNPQPDVTIVDNSIDVHSREDYNNVIKQYGYSQK